MIGFVADLWALVRSEWVKVRSTKAWWILMIIGAVMAGLLSLPLILVATAVDPETGEPLAEMDFTDPAALDVLWPAIGSATVVALILGILSFTGEYRHETITDTFLTEPRRSLVIAAKAIVNALLGVLLALVTATVVVGVALLLVPAPHAPFDWTQIAGTTAGAALAYALFAIIGVALGGLITNQIAAVVLALLWIFVAESVISAFLPDWGPWLPGGAAAAILGADGGWSEALAPGPATALLLAYAAVLAALAGLTTLRRDIT